MNHPTSQVSSSQFATGTLVRIRREFGGNDAVYVVATPDEGKGRLDIRPLIWTHGPLAPLELVRTNMVQRVDAAN